MVFSAGVGRTGAYILIDAMLERAKREATVDIFNFVRTIREDRMHMIQTFVRINNFIQMSLSGLRKGGKSHARVSPSMRWSALLTVASQAFLVINPLTYTVITQIRFGSFITFLFEHFVSILVIVLSSVFVSGVIPLFSSPIVDQPEVLSIKLLFPCYAQLLQSSKEALIELRNTVIFLGKAHI